MPRKLVFPDLLPTEYPPDVTLRIYVERFAAFFAVLALGLIPLVVLLVLRFPELPDGAAERFLIVSSLAAIYTLFTAVFIYVYRMLARINRWTALVSMWHESLATFWRLLDAMETKLNKIEQLVEDDAGEEERAAAVVELQGISSEAVMLVQDIENLATEVLAHKKKIQSMLGGQDWTENIVSNLREIREKNRQFSQVYAGVLERV